MLDDFLQENPEIYFEVISASLLLVQSFSLQQSTFLFLNKKILKHKVEDLLAHRVFEGVSQFQVYY